MTHKSWGGEWHRKGALTIADAVYVHLNKKVHVNDGHRTLLKNVQLDIQLASKSCSTSEQDLGQLRLRVCTICRQYKLYECDLHRGWSQNCALVKGTE